MLQWKIGDVTVTRIVEMEVPVKYIPKYSLPRRRRRPKRCKTMPWLYPHFVTEDGALVLSIHALLVEAPGLRLVVDTCVGNDKPRGLTRQPAAVHAVPAASGRRRLDARERRCRRLHASACRSCRLEHDEGRTTNGCRPSPTRAT